MRVMTKKQLGKEFLENMDLTREQYLELCALCDDLGLDKAPETFTQDDFR